MEERWESLLSKESKALRERFLKWRKFMDDNVNFQLKESDKHTKQHCARVLLYALKIGETYGLDDEDMDALACAAVFHDSRRQDDWYDVGHGKRAAEYYREFCDAHHVPMDKRTYEIMAYHDRDDADGIRKIQADGLNKGVLLYEIFKDADALDRFRLGPNELDTRFLRTDAAKGMVDYARNVVQMDSHSHRRHSSHHNR